MCVCVCGVPDPGLVFQASLTSAQVLLPDSQASLISLLLEGHSLLALATIMFAPGGINQVRPGSTHPPTRLLWLGDHQHPDIFQRDVSAL